MRVLDLFSGIGGFSLAAHSQGFSTIAFCEIEPYAQSILRRHFPGVPIFDDVKELTADALADAASVRCDGHHEDDGRGGGVAASAGRPERDATEQHGQSARGREALILTGGFPCQDISYAGKGAGLAGERSGLFYEVARLVDELRPDYVLLENVSALLTRGLDAVLGTLASLGYDALWACIPACAVGAPHRRDRVWILAVPNGSTERLTAMYSHVLSRLTQFGDLSDGWPTATASDAWASDKERNQTQPCTGRVLTGKAGLGLGHAAAINGTWPTPMSRDYKGACASEVEAGGNGRLDNVVEGITGNGTWPTPSSGGESGGPHGIVGGTGHRQMLRDAGLDEATVTGMSGGALNPAWVETLMGYPIGYTLPEGEPLCGLPIHWPAGLGAPQHEWEPPRLTTEKQHRASRLKCLGNSIVPQVAVLWMEAIALDAMRPESEGE